MSFRDEGESAKARADALERELAEREAELAEREAELAARDAELAETRRALSERSRERVRAEGKHARDGAARAEAEENLRALRRRGQERAQAEALEAEQAAGDASAEHERERRARMLRSVSRVADVEWGVVALAVGLPATLSAVFLAPSEGPRVYLYAALAAALVIALVVRGCRAHSEDALRREVAWARSRPYTLAGYPEVLGSKPRWQVVDSLAAMHERMRGMFPSRDEAEDADAADADDHAFVWLRLELRGGEPPELAATLAAFDPSFVRRGPGRFRATSPVTASVGRSGPRSTTEDTNVELRRWVHRLDAEVLVPLRAAHGLSRAQLGLSRGH